LELEVDRIYFLFLNNRSSYRSRYEMRYLPFHNSCSSPKMCFAVLVKVFLCFYFYVSRRNCYRKLCFLSTLCTEWQIRLCSLLFHYKFLESYYTTSTGDLKKATFDIKVVYKCHRIYKCFETRIEKALGKQREHKVSKLLICIFCKHWL